MKNIIQLLINYVKQPSTWRGVSVLFGAIGFHLSPEAWLEIGAAVAAAIAAIEIVRNERASK